MKWRTYGWYVVAAVGCGVLLSFSRINPYTGQIAFSDLVLQLSGSQGTSVMRLDYICIVEFALLLLPFFLYQFYGGIQLYRQFCVASVYIFSRTTNRVKWCVSQLWGLCKGLVVLQVFLQGTTLLVAALRWDVVWTVEGWVLLGIHVLNFTLWTFAMALGVNVAALIWGSSTGFFVVFLLQAGMLAALCAGNGLDPSDPALAKLLLLAFVAAAVAALGLVMMEKKDILVSNLETGGV